MKVLRLPDYAVDLIIGCLMDHLNKTNDAIDRAESMPTQAKDIIDNSLNTARAHATKVALIINGIETSVAEQNEAHEVD